ncbi:MAG: macro domain-containing protein [Candidatus Eisenbacteria bacterium]|nr:macro domain-containing protein [Candidatus Eisenbacteria bacterium]
MIRFTTGDILSSDTEAVVNTVNCVGVMGRGIALRFKDAFPANFDAYTGACKAGKVEPGRMFVFETGRLTPPRWVINFPTKRHWRGKSLLPDIESGLDALREEIRERGIRSIAIPPLGCGLGGLDWNDVRPRIVRALSELSEVEVVIFEPSDVRAPGRSPAPGESQMTVGRAALVTLMRRYLDALLDPSISLLEVHKLMYFLQAAGEPLKLRYTKGPYGPYAENLRHVLRQVEGTLVAGYGSDGDAPETPLQLVAGAFERAHEFLNAAPDTRSRIERTAKLVDGFETPFGLELLATVHWVATEEKATGFEQIAVGVHAWSKRKRLFTREQIELAMGRLREQALIGA